MSKRNQDRHGHRTVHQAASSTSCLCQDCDTIRGSCTENTLVARERKEILRNRPPIVSGSSAPGSASTSSSSLHVARHVTAPRVRNRANAWRS